LVFGTGWESGSGEKKAAQKGIIGEEGKIKGKKRPEKGAPTIRIRSSTKKGIQAKRGDIRVLILTSEKRGK